MDKEKIINDYMKKLGISREEAEQLYEDDLEDFIGEEGEAMTEKAKAIKIRGDGEEKKKKSTRERKIDEAKKEILDRMHKSLETFVIITNVKTETEISFIYNDEKYTLKLTKHRPKKQSIDRLHKSQPVFLCIFTIDKNFYMWYNWRPANYRAGLVLPVKWYSAQIFVRIFVQIDY